jgi:sulfur-oxidizing protein SoxY
MRRIFGHILLALLATAVSAVPARAQSVEEARARRWQDLRQALFGDRAVAAAEEGEIELDMPERALDGARVPVVVHLHYPGRVKSLYFVVDENPMPLAARVGFGPAANPISLGLQIRVDRYTHIHIVAETDEGELRATARFVKAAGGCSGPPPVAAVAGEPPIGTMSLQAGSGAAPEMTLSIEHPNCTGMQLDPATRGYIPARFLQSLEITRDGASVLRLETGISLAADPVMTFRLAEPATGKLGVVARDSDGSIFERIFELDRQPSRRPPSQREASKPT